MSETSEIGTYRSDDTEAGVAHAKKMLEQIASLKPEEVGCMLICAVTRNGEVKVGMMGSDGDIAKMLVTVTTVAREGILKAGAESNPTNETAH